MKFAETITADDLRELAEDLRKEAAKTQGRIEQKSQYSRADRERLQRVLLKQTIQLAFDEVPYYQELARSTHIDIGTVRGIKSLRKLPVLESSLVRADPYRLIAKSKEASIVTVNQSSGTTGKPVRVYVSLDELDAIKYYNDLMSVYVGAHRGKISLVIGDWSPTIFGTLSDFAIASRLSPVPKRRYERVINDLLYEHKLAGLESRVSVLYFDSTRFIRVLTEEMLAKGIDPLSTSVRDVWIMESVSKATRKWIMTTWKAKVHSLYSLAECLGGAAQCEKGNYHFDIRLIPEVVNTRDLQPVEEGSEGKLLITTLSPFQQAMPLLRYSTDDIVIRGPDHCKCGEEGLSLRRILGKMTHCAYLGDVVGEECERRWLGYTEVKDILEEFPQYFIIEGYGAPVIRFDYKIRPRHAKLKITVGLNKKMAGEKNQALKLLSEEMYRSFGFWQHWLDNRKMSFQVKLRTLSNMVDPRASGFFPQH